MKPLMLHGHERAVTQIKYNREGDLVFSCAKDSQPNVWYTVNGERLGTYKGHGGAVWCIDVNWDTTKVLTGSADNSCRLWDCELGKSIFCIDTKSAVRTCGFSYSGNLIMMSTDKTLGQECELSIFDLRDGNQISYDKAGLQLPIYDSKVTSAVWGPLDEVILTGHENGALAQFDVRAEDMTRQVFDHRKQINDIQANRDLTMVITASKDHTARLFDMFSLDCKKVYKTERPVNSAAISPIKPHVVLGGGQEAAQVTTTSTKIGKFDARFFHLVFEEEFGRVRGHFGPINSCSFHPDGSGYISGGEDGYVRVHQFDSGYFDFELDF